MNEKYIEQDIIDHVNKSTEYLKENILKIALDNYYPFVHSFLSFYVQRFSEAAKKRDGAISGNEMIKF